MINYTSLSSFPKYSVVLLYPVNVEGWDLTLLADAFALCSYGTGWSADLNFGTVE
jgi:hypothetical protein